MPARIEANEYGLKIDDTTIYWDSITRTEVDPTKVDNPAYKAWQDLPREPQKPDKAKDLDLEYSRMLRNRSDAIKQRDKAEKTDQWIKSLPEKHPIIYKTEKNPRFYSTFGWVLFLGFICFVAALGIQKNPDHPDTGFAVLVYMVSVISILRLAWRDTRGGWEHEFELVPQIPDHDYSLDAIKHSNEAEHYDKAASKTLIEIMNIFVKSRVRSTPMTMRKSNAPCLTLCVIFLLHRHPRSTASARKVHTALPPLYPNRGWNGRCHIQLQQVRY